jgi:hypothetical protein
MREAVGGWGSFFYQETCIFRLDLNVFQKASWYLYKLCSCFTSCKVARVLLVLVCIFRKRIVWVSGVHWRKDFLSVWHILGWGHKIEPYDRSVDLCSTRMGHSVMLKSRIKLPVLSSTVYVMTQRGKNTELLSCRFLLYIVLLSCLTWIAGHSICRSSLSTISAVTAGVVFWGGPCVFYSLLFDWYSTICCWIWSKCVQLCSLILTRSGIKLLVLCKLLKCLWWSLV